jgi:hypothetical protein
MARHYYSFWNVFALGVIFGSALTIMVYAAVYLIKEKLKNDKE